MASKQMVLATLSVLVVVALGVWGWSVDPDRPLRWAFIVFFLPTFWGMIELLQGGSGRREEIMNWHRSVVAAIGLMMALKVGSQLAVATHLLDAQWGPVARRATGVLFGFFLTVWGNYLPKIISPWRPDEEWFDWQSVHRFVGWLATLSGIALMLVWLTLPPQSAKLATLGISITFSVLGVGRKFMSVADYARRPSPPAPKQEST
jgi:hypothetical protein